MKINEYKIKRDIKREFLEGLGFTNYLKDYLYYRILLHGPITLNIEIPVINDMIGLDNIKIRVIDEEFLQPYIPFYNTNLYRNNEFLDIVILKYNQEMDNLVRQGIFEKVNEFETFSFKEKSHNLIDETLEKISWPNISEGDIPRQFGLEKFKNSAKKLILVRESKRK